MNKLIVFLFYMFLITKLTSAPAWFERPSMFFDNNENFIGLGSGATRMEAEIQALESLGRNISIDLEGVVVSEFTAGSVRNEDFFEQRLNQQIITRTKNTLIGFRELRSEVLNGTYYLVYGLNRRAVPPDLVIEMTQLKNRINLNIQNGKEHIVNKRHFLALNSFTVARIDFSSFLLRKMLFDRLSESRFDISDMPSEGTIEALLQEAKNSTVITVQVSGDVNNRIESAFTKVINDRGFMTARSGTMLYKLTVSFALEDLDHNNQGFRFARYSLNYSLRDFSDTVIFSGSENDREGHRFIEEARQWVIRTAEQSIATTGFATRFDQFLETLQ
jgi:hypothetical protein